MTNYTRFDTPSFYPTKLPAEQVIVIYHANCADGFTAAWCFWNIYRDSIPYYPGQYNNPPPDMINGRHVFLVDFSYPREVVESMLNEATSVTLIDHHKSALKDLQDVPGLLYHTSLDASGARLAWDYLYPNEAPPQMLLHVEDRDLWRFSHPNTRAITAALFSYDYEFYTWNSLMNADSEKYQELVLAGGHLERKHRKDVKMLAELCKRRAVIADHDVPIANVPHIYASDVGNLLSNGEPFAACYYDSEEHRHFSLRSVPGGEDVSEIAKLFDGGGHERASGFKVPRDHVLARI